MRTGRVGGSWCNASMSGHVHVPALPPSILATAGRTVDVELLDSFVGATVDGCFACQLVLMDDLVADPVSTARLVELACISLDRVMGGLPGSALYDHEPGPASLEFRRLARAGLYDGGAVYRECEYMTLAERRAAAYTAVDTLVAAVNMA